MFSRMTTISGEPGREAAMTRFFTETVQPLVDGLPGSAGALLLGRPGTGRVVALSLWASEQARAEAADQLLPVREEASKVLVGPAVTEDLEVLAGEPPTGGALVLTRLRVDPDRLPELVRSAPSDGLLLADPARGTAAVLGGDAAAWAAAAGRCGAEVGPVWEAEVVASGLRPLHRYEAAVRRIYAAISAGGDLDDLDAVIAPHLVDHARLPGTAEGLAGLKAAVQESRAAFPDLQLTMEQYLEQGEMACSVLRMTGTQAGPFLGAAPTHRTMDITAIDVGRFVDGRCVEHWGVEDGLTMLVQLGVLTVPEPQQVIHLPTEVRT